MIRGRVRILIALLLPLLVLALINVTASAWLFERSSISTVERVVGWSLGNAQLRRRIARTSAVSVSDAELERGAENYRQVLARNPLDYLAWEGLTNVETRLGGDSRGEAVLRGWATALPNSPRATWTLANLLLRQGHLDESLPYFRRAATSDPLLLQALFPLAWKALEGSPERILAEVVPQDEPSRVDYFYYLINARVDMQAAEPVWQLLRSMGSPRAPELGMLFTERLASRGLGSQAERVWRLASPRPAAKATAGNVDRVTNGDFERPLLNAGLDWRLKKGAGYRLSLDDFNQSSGARSLRLDFDGTGNPDLHEAAQWIVVEPDRDYRFEAFMKTDNLTTDSGVFWSLSTVAVNPADFQEWVTASIGGSNPWTKQTIDLRTGPGVSVLLLELRRLDSKKLDHLLKGTVWVDSASLILH